MFGQQNNRDDQQANDQNTEQPTDAAPQQPTDNFAQPDDAAAAPVADQSDANDTAASPAPEEPAAPAEDSWQHPGTPLDGSAPISDVISPAGSFPKPASLPISSTDSGSTPNDDKTDELLDIKQQALQKLVPMIDELEQAPEEHFRTLMMMIQASDDNSLVPKAYEAAKSIEDEQVRAQALLDIVNEINYFTQPHEGN